MQHGMVDMVITGADRVTRTGDVVRCGCVVENSDPMAVL